MGVGGTSLSRPSWAEVDLSAVAHNVRTLSRHAPGALMCAVVKADGYGHGAVEVAETALANGASWLAVATVEEGVRLRDARIAAPILLLSEPPSEDMRTVVAQNLTPTLYRPAGIDALASAVGRAGAEKFAVHLKIDTGMHRLGARPESFPELVGAVGGFPSLRVGGIWSHFAVADTDPQFTRRQIKTYLKTLAACEPPVEGGEPPLRHLANTPGMLFHPDSHLDMVRVGLGIYGLYPHPSARDLIRLRPAMRIVTHVAHLLRHPAGARPSYGRVRPLAASSVVATLPVGYADGVPRSLSERGRVLIGGRRFPMAGRVTMDQLVVDVGDHPVRVGDQAVLVGGQGDDAISFDEWADVSDTINYEVVSRIGPRLPRRYVL